MGASAVVIHYEEAL